MNLNLRQAALKKYTGKYAQNTEKALLRGLYFLKECQLESGAWTSSPPETHSYELGSTGLVLLAFLAHGETPKSHSFDSTVEKGIPFLTSEADNEGLFRISTSHSGIYEHCIATYAIAEAYGLTHAPELHPITTKNLQRSLMVSKKAVDGTTSLTITAG